MDRIEYRDSILDEEPEVCGVNSIMRYYLDRNNWIEVTTTDKGIEIRSNGGHMAIEPQSGNTVEVYLRNRS